MGVLRVLRLCILCWVLSTLCSITKCGGSDVTVKFLKAPHAFSHLNSATFAFEVLNSGSNRSSCSNCSLSCKVCMILVVYAYYEHGLFVTFIWHIQILRACLHKQLIKCLNSYRIK
jgi:hypothetical protein